MLNEQKLNDRMMNLMESGFFGKKILNEGVFAPQVKIKLFQAAYNYIYNQNISVDGEKGVQTNAAIEAVKKALGKDKLDDAGVKDFYEKFLTKLDESKESINVGQGGANTNKILNQAIQALINLAGTPIGIDGVIGTKTIAAIKTVAEDSEVINSQNITTITTKAVKNILQLGVDGIATIDSKSPEELNSAQNREKIEANYAKSIEDWKNFPCITSDTAYKKMKRDDGTVMYKNGGHYLFGNGRGYRAENKTSYTFTCENGKLTVKDDKPVSKDTAPSSNTQQDDGKIRAQFNVDLKKLTQIISTYDNKWGFYELSDSKIIFKDSLDNKTLLTSTFIPVNLQKDVVAKGGYWVYNNGVYTFKSKNTAKIFHNFKTS